MLTEIEIVLGDINLCNHDKVDSSNLFLIYIYKSKLID
jgi:hypothetical protein